MIVFKNDYYQVETGVIRPLLSNQQPHFTIDGYLVRNLTTNQIDGEFRNMCDAIAQAVTDTHFLDKVALDADSKKSTAIN